MNIYHWYQTIKHLQCGHPSLHLLTIPFPCPPHLSTAYPTFPHPWGHPTYPSFIPPALLLPIFHFLFPTHLSFPCHPPSSPVPPPFLSIRSLLSNYLKRNSNVYRAQKKPCDVKCLVQVFKRTNKQWKPSASLN